MITVRDIHKSYATVDVLSGISFSLGTGQKAALVGANGSGKSTLLRIISEQLEPDSGSVSMIPRVRMGYLSQELVVEHSEATVLDYLKERCGIAELDRKMDALVHRLEEAEAAEEYYDLLEDYNLLEGTEFESQAAKILNGLGFPAGVKSLPLANLSGGQRTKIGLAAVLLMGANVLLLDEPTNNLDLRSIIWLEQFLANTKATCIIISHDRRFLDRIIRKVFEIDWYERTIIEHTGTYSQYIEWKMREIRSQQAQYEQGLEEKNRLQQSAQSARGWSARGRYQTTRDNDKIGRNTARERSGKLGQRASAIEQQADRIELVIPKRQREPTIFALRPQASDTSSATIELNSVVAGYPDGFRLSPLTLRIEYGERVAIIGHNAAGKSTLLRTLTGDLSPLLGRVHIGSGAIIGNLTQHGEELPPNSTVTTFLQPMSNDATTMYQVLANFNFQAGEVAKKKIGVLSPGERSRIVLASFALRSTNVLLLDEPTNHLDIDALDALESVIRTFEGTIIFVSHDRYFLETSGATRILLVDEGVIQEVSSYQEYLQHISVEI